LILYDGLIVHTLKNLEKNGKESDSCPSQGGAGSFRDGVFKVVSPNVVQLLSRGELEGGVLGLPWDEGSNFDVMD